MRFVILLSCLISCSSIPDVPICIEESHSQAFCTNTISDVDFYINDVSLYEGETYWEARVKMILIPYTSWSKLKSYIIKQCKKTNCGETVSSWDRKINSIDKSIKEKE